MLATVMNAKALRDGLDKQGLNASVKTGLSMPQVCDNYTQRDARQKIGQGEIVILAAGTGNPYFTTDTGASLRAIEIQANLMVKATKVDGIYDSDPMKNPEAKRYSELTFDQAIDQRLGVMDISAMVMCQENNMNIAVCDISEQGALLKLASGEDIGTRVSNS
jgi:uridylate kinase